MNIKTNFKTFYKRKTDPISRKNFNWHFKFRFLMGNAFFLFFLQMLTLMILL